MSTRARNTHTRKALLDALLALMKEKDFEEISVSELSQRAGVSRAAFYRAYSTKEDVISDYLNQLFLMYAKRMTRDPNRDKTANTKLFFTCFRANSEFLTSIIEANLEHLIMSCFCDSLTLVYNFLTYSAGARGHEGDANFARYYSRIVAGGFCMALIEWVSGGMAEEDEVIAQYIYDIFSGVGV